MRIDFIRRFIDDLKDKYNISDSDLVDDGAIYYENGNDGTDFDFNANNMTCEFMCFWKDSEVGAIKVNQRGDTLVAFVYDHDDPWNTSKCHEEERESDAELYDLCCFLYGSFDKKGIYDQIIHNWNLKDYVYIDNEEDEEDDPFESPYDDEYEDSDDYDYDEEEQY